MENLEEKLLVSRETLSDFKLYQTILTEWQKRFNLVSNKSLADAWNRHFLDSAQLFQYIPSYAKTLADFGSGAGFPGIVLAIMAKTKTPYLKVTLIESVKKKTVFLNEVSTKLSLDLQIENERIENITNRKYDVITSRAMCSLEKLFEYAKPFCKKETICIFPKGASYKEEIALAKKNYKFDCEIKDNIVSSEGKILIITNIVKQKGEKNA